MRRQLCVFSLLALAACANAPVTTRQSWYGTLEPFASEAVYFVMTDRFVNGDSGNDQLQQGTFDLPVPGAPPGLSDNVGYLGGDFRGLLENADYIREMGFSSVWITPVVDNPDEPFRGGDPVAWGVQFTDGGKTGYHGYWGVNFFKLDEHLPSPGLGFSELSKGLKVHGLKTVLDIVANHGSPSFSMAVDQPKYGEIYGRDGELLADHQNLAPGQLDPLHNPLHQFFHSQQELAQLSNLDERNPALRDYLISAYEYWIEQGADAFRIDTIKFMPLAFWKEFSDRIRARHPGFFMFGEAFDYDPQAIAQFTRPENGAMSVLDFPLRQELVKIFENPGSDYAGLAPALFLREGPYANPYELMTFYDNHDMARLNASDSGFIDAHNWLFTARGIPVIYYGSESGFQRGAIEHAGNRNYFGIDGITAARRSPIRQALSRIAAVRAQSVALQRGLQLNLELSGDRAAFYRVFQHQEGHQIALVLLNKGEQPESFLISEALQPGTWQEALSQQTQTVVGELRSTVAAHSAQVWLLDEAVSNPELLARLQQAVRAD